MLQDFYELWPERFSNKTNGVTPRRFLALANPGLRALLDETHRRRLADATSTQLRGLEAVRRRRRRSGSEWRAVKRANKARLADYVRAHTGIELDPDWLFDIQVKRIHEYKRQHLNVLHIITLYHRLKREPAARPAAARLHLRRQGRARLLHGQAHHQADQRAWPRRSTATPT